MTSLYSTSLINPLNEFLIKLRRVNIEIERRGQNTKSEKEYISFLEGEYQFKNTYDQEKFLFITSCLMDGVCELITYYFKNKKLFKLIINLISLNQSFTIMASNCNWV